jgi:hypothetical protein
VIKFIDNCVVALWRAGEMRARGIGMQRLLPFATDVEDGKGLEEMCKIA